MIVIESPFSLFCQGTSTIYCYDVYVINVYDINVF